MSAVRQCVVLMGGLATRLGGLAADMPKPMLPVDGRPFLSWLLREVQRFGIERAVLLTGHLSEVVEAAIPSLVDSLPKQMDIRLSREPVRAGTGGALHHAAGLLDERFLMLNGDSLLDARLGEALARPEAEGVLGRLMVRPVADASRYGVVTLAGEAITAFHPRPVEGMTGPGLINGGVYVFDRQIPGAFGAAMLVGAGRVAGPGSSRAAARDGVGRVVHRYRHPR